MSNSPVLHRDREVSPTGVCRDREVSPTGEGIETRRSLLPGEALRLGGPAGKSPFFTVARGPVPRDVELLMKRLANDEKIVVHRTFFSCEMLGVVVFYLKALGASNVTHNTREFR